jgi:hypothetical protein
MAYNDVYNIDYEIRFLYPDGCIENTFEQNSNFVNWLRDTSFYREERNRFMEGVEASDIA